MQLVLSPDPTISPLATLLKQLGHLSVIVGSEDGLVGVSRAGPLPGGGTAVDWDGDKLLEARFDGVTVRGDALPVLEIGLEDNADRELDFRILGFGDKTAAGSGQERSVAEGGTSATVARGQIRRIGAPFNLTSRARPPRVLLVVPPEGSKVLVNLVSVVAVLSTTVKPQTVTGNVQLLDPKRKPIALSSVKVETTIVASGAFSREERSLVTMEFSGLIVDGTHEVRIGPGIVSSTGLRFDQNPETAAEDAHVSRFLFDLAVGGGKPCDSCPSGYTCHPTLPGCVPVVLCLAGCPKGLVCDTAQQQCVADCRVVDFCFETDQSCDVKSGICH